MKQIALIVSLVCFVMLAGMAACIDQPIQTGGDDTQSQVDESTTSTDPAISDVASTLTLAPRCVLVVTDGHSSLICGGCSTGITCGPTCCSAATTFCGGPTGTVCCDTIHHIAGCPAH